MQHRPQKWKKISELLKSAYSRPKTEDYIRHGDDRTEAGHLQRGEHFCSTKSVQTIVFTSTIPSCGLTQIWHLHNFINSLVLCCINQNFLNQSESSMPQKPCYATDLPLHKFSTLDTHFTTLPMHFHSHSTYHLVLEIFSTNTEDTNNNSDFIAYFIMLFFF